jgi:hypothetical protein
VGKYERERYVSRYGTFFAPVDGVEYFGAFFGRERSVFVKLRSEKNACGHTLRCRSKECFLENQHTTPQRTKVDFKERGGNLGF